MGQWDCVELLPNIIIINSNAKLPGTDLNYFSDDFTESENAVCIGIQILHDTKISCSKISEKAGN